MKYPDDKIVSNTPSDQPNTNYELHRALIDASSSATVYASSINAIGEKGSTWWVKPKLDEALYRTKYKGLDLVSAEAVYPLPENGSGAKLPRSSSTAFEDVSPRGVRGLRRGRQARRDGTDWTSQSDAPRQLTFISTPSSHQLDEEDAYHYKKSAGKGVCVYVVDQGINLESSERRKGGRSEPDFIFVGPFATNQKVGLDDDGHDTCMADLAAGWVNGVAKSADITAVQVDDSSNPAFNGMAWLLEVDALAKVVDDIANRGIADRAVLLVASTLQANLNGNHQKAFVYAYWTMMNKVDEQGAALVVTTMNDQKCTEWPCMFANPDYDYYIPHMIAVGAADIETGSYYEEEENRDDWPSIFYAPGDDDAWEDLDVPGPIICAAGTGDNNALETEGPSAATALTAGLMAYFKGTGLTNAAARAQLYLGAYKRAEDKPRMPYNNWDPDD